jgi:hypothetical protein
MKKAEVKNIEFTFECSEDNLGVFMIDGKPLLHFNPDSYYLSPTQFGSGYIHLINGRGLLSQSLYKFYTIGIKHLSTLVTGVAEIGDKMFVQIYDVYNDRYIQNEMSISLSFLKSIDNFVKEHEAQEALA